MLQKPKVKNLIINEDNEILVACLRVHTRRPHEGNPFYLLTNHEMLNGNLTQAIDNFERDISQIKLNQQLYQSLSIFSPTPKYTSNGKNYYRTMDGAGIAKTQAINPTAIKLGIESAGLTDINLIRI